MTKFLLALSIFILLAKHSISKTIEIKTTLSDSSAKSRLKSDIPAWKKDLAKFDLQTWKTTFNKSFATVLGATGPNNQIGNYATLDPLNGSFNLKGSIPIQIAKKNINFLSVTLKGGLLSDNSSQLFKKGKINTNTSVSADYHFLTKIYPKSILVDKEKEAAYIVNHTLLSKETNIKINAININAISDKLLNLQRDTIEKYQRQAILKTDLLTAQKQINEAIENGQSDSLFARVKKYRKSIAMRDSISRDLDKVRKQIDSLCLTLDYWPYMQTFLRNVPANAKEKSLEKLKDSTLIESFAISWFTASTSIGKSNLYEYSQSNAFGVQIDQTSKYNNSIGLAWNIYLKSKFMHQAWLFNIGISQSLSNNTDTLSTTDITQEYVYKNQSGDTTRKISQKYSAYTDPIISKRQFSIYINTYYIFGDKGVGMHLYSNFVKPKLNTGYLTSGFGFIVPFNPRKKDLPIINTEAYIQTNDLFGTRSDGTFKQRTEVGIKFTLPFNFI